MKGKREMKNNKKGMTALVALVLILCCTVGGTLAWIVTATKPVKNTFTPGEVGTEITETIKGKTKEKVVIKNTGNVSAYIRATVIVNWVDDAGNVCAVAPEGAAYDLTIPATNTWVESGSYYYYTKKVDAGGETDNLLTATETSAPTGYHLQITILSDAVQAEGMGVTTAEEAFAKAAENK